MNDLCMALERCYVGCRAQVLSLIFKVGDLKRRRALMNIAEFFTGWQTQALLISALEIKAERRHYWFSDGKYEGI